MRGEMSWRRRRLCYLRTKEWLILQHFVEEPLGGGKITMRGQKEIDRVPVLEPRSEGKP